MNRKKIGMIGASALVVAGVALLSKILKNQLKESNKEYHKMLEYYNILVPWLELKQKGNGLEKYLLDNGYKSIAIYGMANLGNCLYNELKDASIEIEYAIDKNLSYTWSDEIDIIEFGNQLPSVDAIIVTPVFAYNAIKNDLTQYFDGDIVSLRDIIIGA